MQLELRCTRTEVADFMHSWAAAPDASPFEIVVSQELTRKMADVVSSLETASFVRGLKS